MVRTRLGMQMMQETLAVVWSAAVEHSRTRIVQLLQK